MVARLTDDAPASIGGMAVQEVDTLDGVKYRLADDSWLLIRPSGTEPKLKFRLRRCSATQRHSGL